MGHRVPDFGSNNYYQRGLGVVASLLMGMGAFVAPAPALCSTKRDGLRCAIRTAQVSDNEGAVDGNQSENPRDKTETDFAVASRILVTNSVEMSIAILGDPSLRCIFEDVDLCDCIDIRTITATILLAGMSRIEPLDLASQERRFAKV
ncbi:MAG: hypothetical protein ACR2QH_08450 [Geminicoccaceae bacterium]